MSNLMRTCNSTRNMHEYLAGGGCAQHTARGSRLITALHSTTIMVYDKKCM